MDSTAYLRFLLSLTLVLGLIFAVTWAIRRWGAGVLVPKLARGAGGARRLALVDVLSLDGKRRLVLVRRDDREHLLLLGINGDLVVEHDCVQPRFELPSPPPPPQPETGA
ncbi:hypothetical protein A6A04_02140 [Paramagnetospirillum marisnigri]|uniref:Uncharacterized protein n=1 Tax=Paramagnetospirillum marisnigri TaxID=1285242 RepID=A0A178MNG9_9PROT|nr:flagellar biosynthetic protein FliO [Paramagnetospirillum marisnigri]OAN50226.1 hypothetical protein A6A04_02140 [Paramagnetospirillum marisnigri]